MSPIPSPSRSPIATREGARPARKGEPGIEFRTRRDGALASLGGAVLLSAGWLIPPRAVTVPLTTLAALAGGVWFMLNRLTENDLATLREASPGLGGRAATILEAAQRRMWC